MQTSKIFSESLPVLYLVWTKIGVWDTLVKYSIYFGMAENVIVVSQAR